MHSPSPARLCAIVVRLALQVGSRYCFLCEGAQRLVVPLQMRGWPKLFPLEKKVGHARVLGHVFTACDSVSQRVTA